MRTSKSNTTGNTKVAEELDDLGLNSSSEFKVEDFNEPNIPNSTESILEAPTTGRIVSAVLVGLLVSFIFGLIIFRVYMVQIKYPSQMEIDETKTGLYCLQNWEVSISNLNSTGTESYIYKEIAYANGNSKKIDFYKKMLGTVSYKPKLVEAQNKYGNPLISKDTDTVVRTYSTVTEGEAVTLSYIDYTKVKVDETKVKELMQIAGISFGCVDYNNKLVDVFCDYMNSLSDVSIPTKSVDDYVPNMVKNSDGTYSMLDEEDSYLDSLLFSSKEFYDLIDRFSIVACKVTSDETIQPSDEWVAWTNLSKEEQKLTEEPSKYSYKDVADKLWCGTYYLLNGYKTKDSQGNLISQQLSAKIGDGTKDNPAGLRTDVVTVMYDTVEDEDGNKKTVTYPIRVSLKEYGVSEGAIKWAESKDIRNRGIDVTSEVQYCYYIFEITNLSDKTLTIHDNSAICDAGANLSPRTGVLYGLTDTLTLAPDETGLLESWNKSTELNKKYVIWGADFARRTEPVWFRLLAGNIDDPSEEKGVTLNKTRNQEATTAASKPSTSVPSSATSK